MWTGIKVRTTSLAPVNDDGEFDFSKLSLASVRTYGADVWEAAIEHIKKLTRQMKDGDGRNAWMTRYIGECVANGMTEDQCANAAQQFSVKFFADHLDEREVRTIIGSVISTDRRNHPEKYQQIEEYNNKNEKRQGRAKALRLITHETLSQLKDRAAGRSMLIDPFVPAQSIIQVVGFNGHGKSLWLLYTLWAASLGKDFGSATVKEKLRSLYLDYESSADTLNMRTMDCVDMFGEMSPEFAIAASSTDDEATVNMCEQEGVERFAELVNLHKPQVVVIDTVRSAWEGMEENSPHSWIKVNQLAVACRNNGMSVIIVHHRNKPTQNGIGRESGSTAQLKDLDLQVFVTKVIEDSDQAKREACIPDGATEVVDAKGNQYTAWQYLRLTLPMDFKLSIVFELTFGKRRQATDNQTTTFIGMAQSRNTGKWYVTSSPSPRQKAEKWAKTKSVGEISSLLQIPVPTVARWIKEK
jgi:hypothetical protein